MIDFIKALWNSEFTLLENPLSTQIYVDLDTLMLFENQDICVSTMKLVKTDRSTYEPHF